MSSQTVFPERMAISMQFDLEIVTKLKMIKSEAEKQGARFSLTKEVAALIEATYDKIPKKSVSETFF